MLICEFSSSSGFAETRFQYNFMRVPKRVKYSLHIFVSILQIWPGKLCIRMWIVENRGCSPVLSVTRSQISSKLSLNSVRTILLLVLQIPFTIKSEALLTLALASLAWLSQLFERPCRDHEKNWLTSSCLIVRIEVHSPSAPLMICSSSLLESFLNDSRSARISRSFT